MMNTEDKTYLLVFIFNMGDSDPESLYTYECKLRDGWYHPIGATQMMERWPPRADDLAKEAIANGHKFYVVGKHTESK